MNDLVSIGNILELCHNEIHKIEDIKLRVGYLAALIELCARYGPHPEIWTKPEILKKACEYARVDPLGLVNIFHSVFLELAKKKGLLGENQKNTIDDITIMKLILRCYVLAAKVQEKALLTLIEAVSLIRGKIFLAFAAMDSSLLVKRNWDGYKKVSG